jgi:hypothetical protein
MESLRLDLTFPHHYEVDLDVELPAGGAKRQLYYPGGTEKGGGNGLVIRIAPHEGSPWFGIFAYGYPKALTGVFSCPDEWSVCVVSSGQGFILRVDDPQAWERVRPFPIYDVRVIPERQMLVYADFTSLAAYGRGGFLWMTPRLSWDGLEITYVNDEYIKGLGWDSPRSRKVEFSVDLRTGCHDGGSSPELSGGP